MPIFIFLVIVGVGVWVYVELKKSPKFDKFCKDLTSDDVCDDSSKNKIKDIVSTEKDLSKQVEQNAKETEKLETESNGINKFLGNRGIGKDAENKEDS